MALLRGRMNADLWFEKWIDRLWVMVIGAMTVAIMALAVLAVAGVVWFIGFLFHLGGC